MSTTSTTSPGSAGRPRVAFFAAIVASVVGLAVPVVSRGPTSVPIAVGVAVASIWLAAMLVTRPAVLARLDRLRVVNRPVRRSLWLGCIAFLYLATIAWCGAATLPPDWHDEHGYLLQARTFAAGHLTMPPHALAESLETFYVVQSPRYASMYFPGTALLHVPAMWLGLPYWITPALIAAGCVVAAHALVAELFDALWGLIAALGLMATPMYASVGLQVLSQPAALLLALVSLAACARWLRTGGLAPVAVMGVAGGWLFITRPLDAVAFLAPIAVAVAWRLRRGPLTAIVLTIVVGVACAAPFIGLQLAYNRATTGEALRYARAEWDRVNYPSATFGFRESANAEPSGSAVPQIREFYADFVTPYLRQTVRENVVPTLLDYRLPLIARVATPTLALAALLPLGLIATRGRAWLAVASGLAFVALYTPYPFFLPHYAVLLIPATLALIVAAADVGPRLLRVDGPRVRGMIAIAAGAGATLQLLATLALTLAHPPATAEATLVNDAVRQIAASERAVLFFRRAPGTNVNYEPVFNYETAWVDDAAVVRLHAIDRAAVRRAIDYYAASQPDRAFYVCHRSNEGDSIRRIGDASDARRWIDGPTTTTAPAAP